MTEKHYIAVVTGANRGIGYEVARQLAQHGLTVIVTARDESQGDQAARQLTEATGGRLRSHQLDVTDAQSVGRFARWMAREYGRVDVLINNAGVYPDEGVAGLAIDPETVRATFETNTLGALRLCQHFLPGMRERGYGRVVNVSSGYGQMQRMGAGVLAYRVSKAALNMMTIILAEETRGAGVLVNAADPGWVRTRMGGRGAPRSIAAGADTIVWLATLPASGPTGGFFHDRREISW